MQKIRTLIVDDEPLARQGIATFLMQDPEVEIVAQCGDGVEAIERIQKDKPDLVFLDVQMPELNGFGVLQSIKAKDMPFVIFVTAYDQYAVQAFQVHALDYLLKPFDQERFLEALQRAKSQVREKGEEEMREKLLSLLKDQSIGSTHLERVMVKSGGKISFLRADEIDWIEAQGDYVCLYSHGKKHLLREKIGDIEQQLGPAKFIRIHRSTIVNVDRIKEMQPLFYGDYAVILQDGTRLTLSRSFREKAFQRLSTSS
jgi:two-component system LytT family response regulator